MKVPRFVKRLLGYSLLAAAFFAWLVVMLKQSGSPLNLQAIFFGLLLLLSVLGLFVGFVKLIGWCFDL